jgi:hypothetical protein
MENNMIGITEYDVYRLTVRYYMNHGDNFDVSHTLACLDSHINNEKSNEFKKKLKEEIMTYALDTLGTLKGKNHE